LRAGGKQGLIFDLELGINIQLKQAACGGAKYYLRDTSGLPLGLKYFANVLTI